MAKLEKADFAGGCFWGVEDLFSKLPGVVKTEVGYEGGKLANPTYEQVCSHTTGHAETVQVTFDAEQMSYEKLLEYFFEIHDPTQHNRQGADVGDNYRSAIFYHNGEQQRIAESVIQKLQPKLKVPIVTEVVPAAKFWPAEDYHQQYYKKQGIAPHC